MRQKSTAQCRMLSVMVFADPEPRRDYMKGGAQIGVMATVEIWLKSKPFWAMGFANLKNVGKA